MSKKVLILVVMLFAVGAAVVVYSRRKPAGNRSEKVQKDHNVTYLGSYATCTAYQPALRYYCVSDDTQEAEILKSIYRLSAMKTDSDALEFYHSADHESIKSTSSISGKPFVSPDPEARKKRREEAKGWEVLGMVQYLPTDQQWAGFVVVWSGKRRLLVPVRKEAEHWKCVMNVVGRARSLRPSSTSSGAYLALQIK